MPLLLSPFRVGLIRAITQPAWLCQQHLVWQHGHAGARQYDYQPWGLEGGVEPHQIMAVGTENPQLLAILGGDSDVHQIAVPWSFLCGLS